MHSCLKFLRIGRSKNVPYKYQNHDKMKNLCMKIMLAKQLFLFNYVCVPTFFCAYKWYEQNSFQHVPMGNSIHVQLHVQEKTCMK